MTAVDPRDEAHAEQDRKVRFDGADDVLAAVPAPLRAAILAMVRARLGWPVLEISQDETVIVDELTADGAGWRAHFAYVFDRDFCSQYDQTTSTRGVIIVAADGTTLDARWPHDPAPPG